MGLGNPWEFPSENCVLSHFAFRPPRGELEVQLQAYDGPCLRALDLYPHGSASSSSSTTTSTLPPVLWQET